MIPASYPPGCLSDEEVVAVVAGCKLGHPFDKFNVRIGFKPHALQRRNETIILGDFMIRAYMPHRDTGEVVVVAFSPVARMLPREAHEIIAAAHDVCWMWLRHELDEAFKFNGLRVFDPHKGEIA